MTDRSRHAKRALGMTAPALALTLAGLGTAWAHLGFATFALGAWTFPLAIIAPAVVAGRMLLNDCCAWRTSLLCLAAITLNLTIEALGTSAQLAMLG